MKLIVGLGNPGKLYQKNRHNLGFQVLDFLANLLGQKGIEMSSFSLNKKFNALTAEYKFAEKKIILAKPQTFMNLSGQAVQAIAQYYKIKPGHIWAIYDDIDLPLGKIRIKKTGSSGGHKGVQSLIEYLNGQNFTRFKIGIQPLLKNKKPLEQVVLENFTKKEEKEINLAIKKLTELIIFALENNLEKAMSKNI